MKKRTPGFKKHNGEKCILNCAIFIGQSSNRICVLCISIDSFWKHVIIYMHGKFDSFSVESPGRTDLNKLF